MRKIWFYLESDQTVDVFLLAAGDAVLVALVEHLEEKVVTILVQHILFEKVEQQFAREEWQSRSAV